MRILIIHNRYKILGGEESVVAAEHDLLGAHGNEVELLLVDNHDIQGLVSKALTAISAAYSFSSRRLVADKLKTFRPDVVHLHNWFPVLSPSILDACAAANVPVVHTLHNYRLLCPNALLFRNNTVCEDCVGKKFAWNGIRNRCYRGGLGDSATVAAVTWAHRTLGTFDHKIARFIALTEFARNKFIEGGLDSKKIAIKANFVTPEPDPGPGDGDYMLFVGRLSVEKGLDVLLDAWKDGAIPVKLRIIGKGPLESQVIEAAASNPWVEYLGPKSPQEVYEAMGSAKALIFPSKWYEGFPRTIVESFAKGTPVIASNLGSMQELIDHGRTGLHFEPGNGESLAQAARWMLDHPAESAAMRRNARAEFESRYSAERNYATLMRIYDDAISSLAAQPA